MIYYHTVIFFFFNDTATTEIYTLSLHDALPVADLLEAFGFERILVETVGVGQTELDIAGSAETTVLVLVPESGDGIQTLKAGVTEIADIYVVNKSDRSGAEKLRQGGEGLLAIRRGEAVPDRAPHHRSGKAT